MWEVLEKPCQFALVSTAGLSRVGLFVGMRALVQLVLFLCACGLCSSSVYAVVVNHTRKPSAVVVLSVDTKTNVVSVLGDVVPKYFGQSMSTQKVVLFKASDQEKMFFIMDKNILAACVAPSFSVQSPLTLLNSESVGSLFANERNRQLIALRANNASLVPVDGSVATSRSWTSALKGSANVWVEESTTVLSLASDFDTGVSVLTHLDLTQQNPIAKHVDISCKLKSPKMWLNARGNLWVLSSDFNLGSNIERVTSVFEVNPHTGDCKPSPVPFPPKLEGSLFYNGKGDVLYTYYFPPSRVASFDVKTGLVTESAISFMNNCFVIDFIAQ